MQTNFNLLLQFINAYAEIIKANLMKESSQGYATRAVIFNSLCWVCISNTLYA